LNGQPIDPLDAVFTPDGAALVSSSRDGIVTLWNSATGQSVGPRFDYQSDAVWRMVVSPSSVIISTSEDGTIAELDVLDLGRACELAAGSLDRRARDRYLGGREPIGCVDD
jgi:WD40 repeat protein